VNRTLTFAARFADGKVPELVDPSDADKAALGELATFPDRIGKAYDTYRNREAVFETMALARLGNKYFNDTEPWHTRKSDPQACANTIHVSLQICAALSVLMEPALPFSSARLRGMLNLEGVRASVPGGAAEGIGWDDAGKSLLQPGHALGEAGILFTKIEDDVMEEQKAKLGATPDGASDKDQPYEPVKDTIEYDDFAKLDFRMGTIVEAEEMPKSKKLVKTVVDLGFEKRQILAGIKEHFKPEELIGKRVAVVANLAPRKMMGTESQGMILMAEDREGALFLMNSGGENGSVIR